MNPFIERHNIEHNKQPELIAAGCHVSLRKMGLMLGLFRPGSASLKTYRIGRWVDEA